MNALLSFEIIGFRGEPIYLNLRCGGPVCHDRKCKVDRGAGIADKVYNNCKDIFVVFYVEKERKYLLSIGLRLSIIIGKHVSRYLAICYSN